MRNKNSPSIIRQKKNLLLFVEAASRLLRHKQFEKLRVSEIVKEAGLSRQTFYRCCQGKYDLLSRYIRQIVNENYDIAEREARLICFPQMLIRAMEDKKELFTSVCTLEEYDSPMSSLKRALYQKQLTHLENRSRTEYEEELLDIYCESFVHIIRRWLIEELDGSPGDISDLILDVMPLKIKNCLLT